LQNRPFHSSLPIHIPSNPADAPLIETAREAAEKLRPAAHDAVLSLFYEGRFSDLRIGVEPVIRQMRRFERLLDEAAKSCFKNDIPDIERSHQERFPPCPCYISA